MANNPLSPEQQEQNKQIALLEARLITTNEALRKRTLEIDKRIAQEQPSLFEDSSKLFEVDISPEQRKRVLEPYLKEIDDISKALESLRKLKVNNTQSLF